jgi:hypothetical protein
MYALPEDVLGAPTLSPGRIVGLIGPIGLGLTRLGLSLLVETSRTAPVVTLDVRGWISPLAAWEMGIDPDRLVVVRCSDRRLWPQVTAALLEGVRAVYAEVPAGIKDQDLRRLAALARARRTGLILRPLQGDLPAGVTHLRIHALGVEWVGTDHGRGRLGRRRLVVEASGKAAGGMEQMIVLEDLGVREGVGADVMRVVPGVAVATPTEVAG